MPTTFQVRGDTAILRVHHFYAEGVLARFTALAGVLPSRTTEARVTFVLGTLPPEATSLDDREARHALTRVLAQAARADLPDGHLTVRVLEPGVPPDEISQAAFGLDPARQELLDRLGELSYADWRVAPGEERTGRWQR